MEIIFLNDQRGLLLHTSFCTGGVLLQVLSLKQFPKISPPFNSTPIFQGFVARNILLGAASVPAVL